LEAKSIGSKEEEQEQDTESVDNEAEEEEENEQVDLSEEFDSMSLDKKYMPSGSLFYSMKPHYPWFPVVFPDKTGHKNIMINFYVPFMHKENYVMEIGSNGTTLGQD
jgi:hypothetical protein